MRDDRRGGRGGGRIDAGWNALSTLSLIQGRAEGHGHDAPSNVMYPQVLSARGPLPQRSRPPTQRQLETVEVEAPPGWRGRILLVFPPDPVSRFETGSGLDR